MSNLILLIEDDQPTIDVYKTALEKTDNFKVDVITLGKEAIDRVKKIKEGKTKKPDLVLLDLFLSDINGLDVLKEIKSQKETKDIPVYVLTNHSDEELKKKVYELKTKKYILKTDYTSSQLIALIKKELEKK